MRRKNARQKPNPALIAQVEGLVSAFRAQGVKRSAEYPKLREVLGAFGWKPFEVFACYNYVTGATKGDWDASVRLAAYVANRRYR